MWPLKITKILIHVSDFNYSIIFNFKVYKNKRLQPKLISVVLFLIIGWFQVMKGRFGRRLILLFYAQLKFQVQTRVELKQVEGTKALFLVKANWIPQMK